MKISLPDRVRQRVLESGEVGKSWIANLDSVVNSLSNEWQLKVKEVLKGGSESLVLKVTLEDSSKAVLKIGLPPDCDCMNEAKVYTLANGCGYPKLLKQSSKHNAILIEQLGESLGESSVTSNLNYSEQIKIICETLKQAWIPLDTAHGLMTGKEKALSLASFIENTWQDFQDVCTISTKSLALDYVTEREAAHKSENCVLVHGDAHSFNTLKAEQGYKFVDPDGLFAEPEFDLAIPMREGNAELLAGSATQTIELAQKRCEYLAFLTNTNAKAIWQWGFMERVSTGLFLLQLGFKDEGLATLEVANRLSSGRLSSGRLNF